MLLRFLKSERGALYPIAIVFFLSALALISHSLMLYSVQYKTYDSLENKHGHATIQLLKEIEKNKIPE